MVSFSESRIDNRASPRTQTMTTSPRDNTHTGRQKTGNCPNNNLNNLQGYLLDSANSNPAHLDAVRMYGRGSMTDSAPLDSSLAMSSKQDMGENFNANQNYRDSRETLNKSQSFQGVFNDIPGYE